MTPFRTKINSLTRYARFRIFPLFTKQSQKNKKQTKRGADGEGCVRVRVSEGWPLVFVSFIVAWVVIFSEGASEAMILLTLALPPSFAATNEYLQFSQTPQIDKSALNKNYQK